MTSASAPLTSLDLLLWWANFQILGLTIDSECISNFKEYVALSAAVRAVFPKNVLVNFIARQLAN
jgi:hypothetical protein